jgi:hypothetical protein
VKKFRNEQMDLTQRPGDAEQGSEVRAFSPARTISSLNVHNVVDVSMLRAYPAKPDHAGGQAKRGQKRQCARNKWEISHLSPPSALRLLHDYMELSEKFLGDISC